MSIGPIDLPDDAVDRLTDVSAIELGFPHDFIASTQEFVYGQAGTDVVPRSGWSDRR